MFLMHYNHCMKNMLLMPYSSYISGKGMIAVRYLQTTDILTVRGACCSELQHAHKCQQALISNAQLCLAGVDRRSLVGMSTLIAQKQSH